MFRNARQYTLRRVTRPRALLSILAVLLLVLRATPVAHEIPRSVTVHAYVKPDAGRLHVIVRVPLAAMRDIQFPERDGVLDVAPAQPDLLEAVGRWVVPSITLLEDGHPVGTPIVTGVRVSLPSNRSFASFDEARAHVLASDGAGDPDVPVAQALLDTAIEYPIRSEHARFALHPAFARLGVDVQTVVRFVTPGGVRAFEFHGDPGLVPLDPRWHQAAWRFVTLGFAHILDGIDHLLFLFCLVIPFRKLRPLILVVTAFTAAHSITLIASALGLAPDALWFPPLVETLIAASILYLALENIVSPSTSGHRWIVAFAFGLVHGFGFSFALKETLQFAGSHLLTSLLAFNIGVELGQVLVLLALVPALHLLYRVVPERIGVIVLSALVAHTAWHWLSERWDTLRAFELPWPTSIVLVRLMIVVVGIAAVAWVLKARQRRASGPVAAHPVDASARRG